MPMERDSFTVYLNPLDDGEPTEHTAVITHQDMIRGEKAHHAAGYPADGSFLALTTAWCWASLMRQQDYSGPFERFADIDCAGIEKADPVTVDPTRQATAAASP